MAKGRMLSGSISTSGKLAKVNLFDALLFTWLIPHCDDYGRMDAEPIIIKAKVVPLRPENVEKVKKSLKNLEKIGLIEIYKVEGRKFLEIKNWGKHQWFRPDRPKKAIFPQQTDNQLTTSRQPDDNQLGESLLPTVNVIESNRIEIKEKERELVVVLNDWNNHQSSPLQDFKPEHIIRKHGVEKVSMLIRKYGQSSSGGFSKFLAALKDNG